jgi:NAD-dependent deacetylase
MDEHTLRGAARTIGEADHVVAFTGAGVSTPSGIPDFRSEGGVWEKWDPQSFNVRRFEADPAGFWHDRAGMVAEVYGEGVEPNPAHEALADLERAGHLDALITQNIDGLHARAGSEEVVELHGNGDRVVCRACDRRFDAGNAFDRVRAGESPPTCRHCGGVLKPDVTLFGEALPEYALFRARSLAERAEAFLVAGSSLSVEPAASLPRIAARTGAALVVVNLEDTGVNADYELRADVAEALPRLVAEVTG